MNADFKYQYEQLAYVAQRTDMTTDEQGELMDETMRSLGGVQLAQNFQNQLNGIAQGMRQKTQDII